MLALLLLSMGRIYVFADEAGCSNFSKHQSASRYYIICTVSCDSCADLGAALLNLRRELVWEKAPVGEYFHCSEDRQVVRDRVFAVLQQHNFKIQASILEKSKAQPQVRPTFDRFYKYAWYYHLQHAAPKFLGAAKEIQINTASVGTQKGQGVFSSAVNDVAQQVIKGGRTFRTNFCRSIGDPCLQAVDYCTWAIQRKWETGKTQAYDLVKGKIIHEADIWSHGKVHYY